MPWLFGKLFKGSKRSSDKASKAKPLTKDSKSATKPGDAKKRPPVSAKSVAAPVTPKSTKPSNQNSTTKRPPPKTISSPSKSKAAKATNDDSRKSSSVFDLFGSDEGTEDSENENLNIETPMEPPELSPEEEDLFEAVEAAQLVEVRQILTNMDFSTVSKLSSKWNVEGDTVFHVAIRRQDEEIIKFLLDFVPNLDNVYYDILLLAVKESSIEITQVILDAISKKPGFGPTEPGKLSTLPRWQNSEFDDHMTPIMQAAIVGNYDLIALFAAHGETLDPELAYSAPTGGRKLRPQLVQPKSSIADKLFCCCGSRQGQPREDISDDYQRLHEYQALTSPEMLCFMSNTVQNFDPLVKIFDYIQELREVRDREDEFRENYTELIENLCEFGVQLLSMCESSKELELLLSKPAEHYGSHDRYPRVILAMEMGLRDFVAHPHTQGILYTQWAGQHWNEWRYFTAMEKIWEFVRRVMFFPMFMLFLFGEQGNRHGRLLACPISRCFYSCISQMIFISLAVSEHLLEAAQPNERMPPNIYIELALMIFVAGHIRGLVRQFFCAPRSFFLTTWNWYDIITCLFFCGCFGCWGYLYINYISDNKFLFHKREPLQRQYWKFYDPLMIADSFLALGTIMACGRLLRYVQLHATIGPIQIALGKMIMNILNFILFFVVVMSSFMLGITIIYAPYRGVQNSITGESQGEVFTTPKNTLTEMYWDLFGMADAGSAELVTLVVQDDSDDEGQVEQYEHVITEAAGKTLYSVYSFFGATILFSSLLVAYISNTFGQIVEDNEINWKFNRAQLWVYFARSSVMPSPFNLIPTLWDVISFFRTLRTVKRNPKKYSATCNCAAGFHPERQYTPEEKDERERTYFNLIKLLIQRYFRSKTALEARALPSAELVSSLGEEVDELKILIDEAIEKIRGPNEKDGGIGGKTTSRLSLPEGSKRQVHSPRKSTPAISSLNASSIVPKPPFKGMKDAASSKLTELEVKTTAKATSQKPINNDNGGGSVAGTKQGTRTSPSKAQSADKEGVDQRTYSASSLNSVAGTSSAEPQKTYSLHTIEEESQGPSAVGTTPAKSPGVSAVKSDPAKSKPTVTTILPPLPPLPAGAKSSDALVTDKNSKQKPDD